MPVMIPLAKLVELDPGNNFELWPTEFCAFVTRILSEVDPAAYQKLREKDEKAATLKDIGETDDDEPFDPNREPTGEFDRTTLHAMGAWAQENDEPHLSQACKFLIRNHGILIVRDRNYSWGTHYKFDPTTLPQRWKGLGSEQGIAKLFTALAEEIRERLEAIGV